MIQAPVMPFATSTAGERGGAVLVGVIPVRAGGWTHPQSAGRRREGGGRIGRDLEAVREGADVILRPLLLIDDLLVGAPQILLGRLIVVLEEFRLVGRPGAGRCPWAERTLVPAGRPLQTHVPLQLLFALLEERLERRAHRLRLGRDGGNRLAGGAAGFRHARRWPDLEP